MQTAQKVILDFVRMRSTHPDNVSVTEFPGNPIIFEIRVSMEDLLGIASEEYAIRAICISSAGLHEEQFLLNFLECECQ